MHHNYIYIYTFLFYITVVAVACSWYNKKNRHTLHGQITLLVVTVPREVMRFLALGHLVFEWCWQMSFHLPASLVMFHVALHPTWGDVYSLGIVCSFYQSVVTVCLPTQRISCKISTMNFPIRIYVKIIMIYTVHVYKL